MGVASLSSAAAPAAPSAGAAAPRVMGGSAALTGPVNSGPRMNNTPLAT